MPHRSSAWRTGWGVEIGSARNLYGCNAIQGRGVDAEPVCDSARHVLEPFGWEPFSECGGVEELAADVVELHVGYGYGLEFRHGPADYLESNIVSIRVGKARVMGFALPRRDVRASLD